MLSPNTHTTDDACVRTFAEWDAIERETRARALAALTEQAAWEIITKEARAVMRAYTTSFFVVSRFLPAVKRAEVEAVYAAVRYPDEIVDTFPLTREARVCALEDWGDCYEEGLRAASLKAAIGAGVPCFLAGFTRVVRERAIPTEHYRAFLAAMRRDAAPRPFASLEDLVENYIYGSAVVVGYFLAHIYGASAAANFTRAVSSARALGIALQLTNFARDVGEDYRRGRVYLPEDFLRAEGIGSAAELDTADARHHAAIARVVRRLAGIAEAHYAEAERDLDAFSPDCRIAIRACIAVYRRLNARIGLRPEAAVVRRESVPAREKFGVLPPSKYWRIPLAYLRK
ncbi:MAG TPA: phytoene/squalene synthase family protein [Pyrinomonadaceae bacterium]|jgi:phytoene synthase